MRARTGIGVLVLSLSLAACGSTVPQQTTLTGGGQGSGGELGGTGFDDGTGATGAGSGGSGSGLGTSSGGGAGAGRSTGATGSSSGSGSSSGAGGSATGTSGSATGGRGTTSGATGTGSGSTGPVTTASGPRDTSPVTVGFINTKVGNIGNIGLSSGQSVEPSAVFKALVNAVNVRGGIAGRKVVPVIADTDTASNDWNSDFGAACQRFTRDQPVSVVVGYSFVQLDSFENCLAKAKVPHLSGAYNVGDDQTLRDYPGLVATNAPSADRRALLQLGGGVREGFLTPKNKIGIITDDCGASKRSMKNTIDPYLKANRLNLVATTTINCVAGAGDAGPGVAQVQAAVLNFVSKGVDRVLVESIPLVLFAATAETQGYRPGYVVTSLSNGTSLEPNMPKPQLANVHGYGWMPHMDVTRNNQPPRTAAQTRCLDLLKAGGVVPKDFNDFLFAYSSCDGLFLYEAALQRTNGRSDSAQVIGAITSLGTSQLGAGLYGGRTNYATHNAPAVYRPFGYDGSCGCFRYTGPITPMP